MPSIVQTVRIATRVPAVLVFLGAARPLPVSAADTIVIVSQGKPACVHEAGNPWRRGDGYLEGTGVGNLLHADRSLGSGDFLVRARLSLEKLDGTAASLALGDNHVGFDGRGGRLFVEGPGLGPTQLLGDVSAVVRAGVPFEVVARRQQDVLSVQIDGQQIFRGPLRAAEVGLFGLRPHRGTMRVYEFSAEGDLQTIRDLAERLANTIRIGTQQVPLASLPAGLIVRRHLGLVTSPCLDGQVVHRARLPACVLFETRATRTPGGDYVLMFPDGGHYGGKNTKVNTMLAYRSSDQGRTWTGPTVAFDIDYNQHGFIPLIPRGSKRIYAFGTQPLWNKFDGHENAAIGYRFSDDDGRTWSPVQLTEPVNDPGYRGMSVMRMCETDRGTWLLGTHEGDWTRKGKAPVVTRQYVLRSEDQGQTWTLLPGKRPGGWYVPEFERMDELRPVGLGGGRVLALARTCEGHLWELRSEDDGKIWTAPKPTPLVHPDAPPMLFPLADGKTLAAFHHNVHSGGHFNMRDRSQLWVSLSTDEGRTWSEPRFVLANALDRTLASDFQNDQCSYLNMFADGEDLHLFLPHRWQRALHLHLKSADLNRLPTTADLERAMPRPAPGD